MVAGRWSSQDALAHAALALALSVGVAALPRPALADGSPQTLPFAQDWTNTTQITADDTWTGVLGIIGYRGDDLATTTGVDPQTVLADGTGVVDVIANQTNTSLNTGGVAEFELANPVVALQGSGTADAPFVLINLNTSGQQDIAVSYSLRDIDATADNATQAVALQYRVGTTGNFTNVAAAFVADATGGPSQATLVTPVSATLPAAANNQAQLQLRIITTNAVGNDEWVGVDDISVSAGSTPDVAPTVISTVPADGATNIAAASDITITFSEAVTAGSNAFTLLCNGTAQPFALSPTSGAATAFTLNPTADLPVGASCTVSASASQISDADGTPTPLGADYSFGFTVAAAPQPGDCNTADTAVGAVQGSGNSAAITGPITVQGVVVGDYEGASPTLRGFYLQDAGDANAETSDGIFVFNNNNNSVSAGQIVQISGTAAEFNGQTQISLSSTTPQIEICGTGSVAPAEVTLPIPTPVNGVSYFERFEGMLVVFSQELSVTDNFTLARFGELGLSANGRLFQPTNFVDPTDDPASEVENDEDNKAAVTAQQDLNNRNRITLDDASTAQNPGAIPYLNAQNTRRLGDTVTGLTGVLNFAFSLYRVQPVGPVAFVDANPRAAAPNVGGNLQVASFNVLNYFNNINDPSTTIDNICGPLANQECRGANSQAEFERQRTKIFAALRGLDADVVGLIEMENDGDGASSAIANLVSGLNASIVAAGGAANTYAYSADPVGYGPESAAALYPGGDDAIKVAFIYKPGRVSPLGAPIASPDTAFENARAPLAQTFRLNSNGAIFTPIINHFKSKSPGTPRFPGDVDTNDGQAQFNESRVKQAQALLNFATQVATRAGDPNVLLLGDLNAYTQEDPIDVLRAGGLTNLIDSGTAYSYSFQAQSGSLDHALANSSMLAQINAAEKWHINADEPIFLDYNAEFKTPNVATPDLYAPDAYRSSDHDPVLVGINLAPPNTPPALTAIATYDTGLAANGAEIIDIRGDRAVLTNAGAGSLDILDTSDLLNITLIQRIEGLVGLNSAAIHPTEDFFLTVAGTAGNVGTVSAYRLSDGALLAQAATGIQPDSVDISPDGSYAVIANEAEGVAEGNNGGAGSLSVVDLRGFDPASSVSLSVVQVALPSIANVPGVSSGRIDDLGRVPIDNTPDTIEPETVTFSADSAMAYITLQENNAVARLNLADNSLSFFGLGRTSHPADLTNGDGYTPSGALTAFREPDGVAVVELNGTRYLVTADEGDSRDDVVAGTGSGRVRGGRTISIFDAATGALVADTGNQLDDIAALFGRYPDTRSDRGGSEPEVLDATVFEGRAIVAVGLERANAVALIDITTPSDPRVFSLVPTGNNPEGVKLVARDGSLFALVANEVSGTLTVVRVPIGPFALSQPYVEDAALALADLYVIDPDADTLNVTITLDPAAGTLVGIPSTGSGVYATSGSVAEVNAVLANITFTPATNQSGTFTANIAVTDGSTTTNGTLSLVGTAANDAPVAADDAYSVNAGSTLTAQAPGVLANDSDPESNALSAVLATGPTNGTLSLDADGAFTYTPNAGFSGVDSFTYNATDSAATSNLATVTITVTDTNSAPTATLAANLCLNGTLPAGSFLLTVGDKETSASKLTVTRSSSNQLLVPNGAITIIGSGKNRVVTILAIPNRSGSAVITLNVSDGQKTTTISFTVTVGTRGNDALSGTEGADMIFGLGGNDTINAGAGSNLVCAGSGNDTITSGDGNDVLLASDGDDTVRSGGGDDLTSGDDGRDTIDAGAGRDILLGGDNDDTLTGGTDADLFDGGRGRDTATDVNRSEGDRTTNIP